MSNACGSCSACCFVFEIQEIGKAPLCWCPKLRRRGPLRGCSCYSTRPADCRAFRCVWLVGNRPAAERPDRIGFVLGMSGATIGVFEVEPGAVRARWAALVAMSRGGEVEIHEADGSATLLVRGEARPLTTDRSDRIAPAT